MNPKDNTLHLIGNAHIDPVWLWRWTEGYQETRATFRSALERLGEFPEFVFTASQAAIYQWVQECEPELFASMQQQARAGRWAAVGGWWMEPDCNLPAGESFARQSLYGQAFFKAAFGQACTVGYCVDSFGHNAMLPQLLRQGGLNTYVFMRPNKIENPRCPQGPFWWEAPDGSRVLAFRLLSAYGSGPEDVNLAALQEVAGHFTETVRDLMFFYGVGNHGGGPTIATLKSLEALETDAELPSLRFSSPERYFEDLQARLPLTELPVYRGELQMHAVGCYAAHSGVKAWNRQAEHLLLAAERWAAVSQHLTAMPAATKTLAEAWQKVLFNQFHDILAGTSIREAYEDVRDEFGAARRAAWVVLNTAQQRLASQVDTRAVSAGGEVAPRSSRRALRKANAGGESAGGESAALVVFNPNTFAATLPVEHEVMIWNMAAGTPTLTDSAGQSVACQAEAPSAVVPGNWRRRLVFQAELPALGYQVYHLSTEAGAPTPPAAAGLSLETAAGPVVNDYVVETDGRADLILANRALRLRLDGRLGDIVSLVDVATGAEVFAEHAAVGVVLDDPSDTWSHGLTAYQDVCGQFSGARLEVIENGPVRLRARATAHYGGSTLRQDFILYRDQPWVEVRVRVDWHEQLKLLKLAFPAALSEPAATFEIPYGVLERPVDGTEVPGQRWVTVSGQAGGERRGVSLISDAIYSYDVTGAQARLTVLRSPVYAHHTPKALEAGGAYEWMEQGRHEFRYLILPQAGAIDTSATQRLAEMLNMPGLSQAEGAHAGRLPARGGFLAVDAANVLVTVLKPAEDGQGWVVRAQETAGRPARATLTMGLTRTGPAVGAGVGQAFPIELGAWQVGTWRVTEEGGGYTIRETNFLEG